MTQTLSITFHLTRGDDSVDTVDNIEARKCGTGVGLTVNIIVKHQRAVGGPQFFEISSDELFIVV